MPTANRGWTLDDPDIWALITTFASGISYLIDSSMLYKTEYENTYLDNGNNFLIISSTLYIITSLRDSDFLWFMPYWGNFLSLDKLLQEENIITEGMNTLTFPSNYHNLSQGTESRFSEIQFASLNTSIDLIKESDSLLTS